MESSKNSNCRWKGYNMSIMKKAQPIWIQGMENEYNLHTGFKSVIDVPANGKVGIAIAAVTIYRLFVNNEYICYGPARGPKGFHRVDRIDLSDRIRTGINVIAVEVVAQNSRTYEFVDQTAFFTCEISVDGETVKATGENTDFTAGIVEERIRKTQRFSYQRAFLESYEYRQGFDGWRIDPDTNLKPEKISRTEAKNWLPRNVGDPLYEKRTIESVVSCGTVELGHEPEKYYYGNSYLSPGEEYKLFPYNELAFCVTDEAQHMRFIPSGQAEKVSSHYDFKENTFRTFDIGLNATGMTAYDISTEQTVTVYCLFDELLVNGDVDFLRADVSNVLKVKFHPGTYRFISFVPLGYKFVKVVVTGGDCRISNFYLSEFKHAPVRYRVSLPEGNDRLLIIYDAAVENFRQNAVDIFMDCPSRERAGWLCDSFFTARSEYCLTGDSTIEHNFLENYLLPDRFEFIPEGMFPMCYPADHTNGIYIPNWAMWLVCELDEYKGRRGDPALIEAFRPKIYKLYEFFRKYENEDGLLEKLDQWVFIEWSKANELVQDVSYPTNMLYASMLEAMGRLYQDPALTAKAQKIHAAVRRLSFNGTFFTDNAVRRDGVLANTNEATEVCQYYAFFCGTATPDLYPELWSILLSDFGPQRKSTQKYPEIYFANAFIGNFLRLDSMMRYGETRKALENIEGYFYDMAATTGTLWEHYDTRASCNHGFASHIVYWLDRIYGKRENG